jgi:anion transporter
MSPAIITLLVLLGALIMFIWEKVPLGITAMSALVILVITGCLEASKAFNGFINTTVILIVAMCVVGGALFETGMAARIGGLITKFAKTERQAVVGVFLISSILSGFLNNAATHVCLAPVVIGIAAKAGYSRSRMMIGLLFGGVIGANLSILGQPHNMYAQTFLAENNTGMSYGFFEIAKFGIPMVILGCIYLATIGFKLMPDKASGNASMTDTPEAANYDHVPAWKQWLSLGVLVAVVIFIIFEKQIGIPYYIIAIIGALLCVITGTLTEKQAYASISANVLLLLGGMLGVASAMTSTGAGEMIANGIISVVGDSPYLLMLALMLVACILTNFMSNNATSTMLLPIGVSLSIALGINMKFLLTAIILGASMACGTPVGMPTNSMMTSLAGYNFFDTVKVGLPYVIMCFILNAILLPFIMPI